MGILKLKAEFEYYSKFADLVVIMKIKKKNITHELNHIEGRCCNLSLKLNTAKTNR